ncbi:hypothetical protein CEXT_327721 [Caerostris extrusa]|uniref:Uncharacterized protein n=1 Tax=Caerostris extrusa TaxID=172846 RepID=A0AAV4X6R8_CAEEX|nr:hypothetical protein CEXT_327721 [Caerostris extrusa]
MESRKISSTFRFHFPLKLTNSSFSLFFPSHSNYRLRAIWTPNGEESPEIKFDWELLLHTSTTTLAEETVPGIATLTCDKRYLMSRKLSSK